MQDDASEAGSVAAEVLPQEQITMLLNTRDFQEKVCGDATNLCCVIVTSTMCPQCGIRRINYPKVPKASNDGGSDGNDEGEGDDDDDDGAADDAGDLDDVDGEGGEGQGGGKAAGGHFFRDVEARLVRRRATAVQRRHVRFFHVCACAESETCIDFLVAADAAYSLLNKKPTPEEVAGLHKVAYRELHELLSLLEVRSTPFMRFYVAGQPLRYSSMAASGSGAAVPSGVTEANDVICAAGANVVKWARVLENAVVVRNEVMRAQDTAVREKVRLAKAEAKRLAREARKRDEAGEGEEEEEEEEEEGDDEE